MTASLAFGRVDEQRQAQIAFIPEFLMERCNRLSRDFANASTAGRFLLGQGFIRSATDGGESTQIWANGARRRVWLMAHDLVECACGVTSGDGEAGVAEVGHGNP